MGTLPHDPSALQNLSIMKLRTHSYVLLDRRMTGSLLRTLGNRFGTALKFQPVSPPTIFPAAQVTPNVFSPHN
jgi:hypothetical protein